ncbi:MAG: hypothetical protein O2907_09200 [Proteobacteria bacterium]|nr:hypothetical protein [Pseudomonadota bacterium]
MRKIRLVRFRRTYFRRGQGRRDIHFATVNATGDERLIFDDFRLEP